MVKLVPYVKQVGAGWEGVYIVYVQKHPYRWGRGAWGC
jgi:hypothetical protein